MQDPALQHDALRAAGSRWVWTDTASGSRTDRPKLAEVMAALTEGDTFDSGHGMLPGDGHVAARWRT